MTEDLEDLEVRKAAFIAEFDEQREAWAEMRATLMAILDAEIGEFRVEAHGYNRGDLFFDAGSAEGLLLAKMRELSGGNTPLRASAVSALRLRAAQALHAYETARDARANRAIAATKAG